MSNRPCTLYLIRHAIAEAHGPEWPDDTKRPLTEKGRARMRAVVAGLQDLDVSVDVILTSPLVRARQTAEIVAEGLKPVPEVINLSALASGGAPAAVAAALGAHRGARALALVGHQPGLGELAAWLIGTESTIAFKKGGVGRIDVERLPPDGSGTLLWLATPRMLRA